MSFEAMLFVTTHMYKLVVVVPGTRTNLGYCLPTFSDHTMLPCHNAVRGARIITS